MVSSLAFKISQFSLMNDLAEAKQNSNPEPNLLFCELE